MRKHIGPTLLFLWSGIVVAVAVNILSEELKDVLLSHLPLVAVGLIVAAGTSTLIFREWRSRESLEDFEFLVPTAELTPAHVGFEVIKSGRRTDALRRPYFPLAYIHRSAVPYDERDLDPVATRYDEEALLQMLRRGESLLLIGGHTSGKTRTLYEVIKRLPDFHVVSLRRDAMPGERALQLLRDRNVLCLLDDLNHYADARIDIASVFKRMRQMAPRLVLAATCRDGPELSKVELEASTLQRVAESFQHRLILRRPDAQEKSRLRALLHQADDRDCATLGEICMSEAFDLMRRRFDGLDSPARDCFRSLQLLSAGGIEPLSHRRLETVLSGVFDRPIRGSALRDQLRALERLGLIVSRGDADPVRAEPAYLSGEEGAWYFGSDPHASLDKLSSCLLNSKDAAGLNALALTWASSGHEPSAIACWEQLIAQCSADDDPEEFARALNNRGISATRRADFQAAVQDFTAALNVAPSHGQQALRALAFRGLSKQRLGDHHGAIVDLQGVLDHPDPPAALLGDALRALGSLLSDSEPQRALGYLTKAIELPGAPAAVVHRARFDRAHFRSQQDDL
ncbi:MAG: hypothetical protein JNL55_01300, partial [Steroidobacter sp.]|nr:hypothetical protein [Steroidobacter sp.]